MILSENRFPLFGIMLPLSDDGGEAEADRGADQRLDRLELHAAQDVADVRKHYVPHRQHDRRDQRDAKQFDNQWPVDHGFPPAPPRVFSYLVTACPVWAIASSLERRVDGNPVAVGQPIGFVAMPVTAITSPNMASLMPALRAAALWLAMQ